MLALRRCSLSEGACFRKVIALRMCSLWDLWLGKLRSTLGFRFRVRVGGGGLGKLHAVLPRLAFRVSRPVVRQASVHLRVSV